MADDGKRRRAWWYLGVLTPKESGDEEEEEDSRCEREDTEPEIFLFFLVKVEDCFFILFYRTIDNDYFLFGGNSSFLVYIIV